MSNDTLDLLPGTFTKSVPIKLFRRKEDASQVFQPVVLAEAPADIVSMPERSLEEKMAKGIAVLKWVMTHFETAFGFSGGKDSGITLTLAMVAASQMVSEGIPVKRFAVLHSNTLVEQPEVLAVAHGELNKVRRWIDRFGLPGEVISTTPALSSQYMVSIIGGKSVISTPFSNANCTTDLKARPLTKARIGLFGKNDVAQGKFVVNVTGVRYGESERRKQSLTKRAESSFQVMMTDQDENVFFAPIADWSSDDVMEAIGLAVNGLLPFETYSDMIEVWRIYRDASGECQVGSGDKPTRGCSARTGCWCCCMVGDDASMNAMLMEPRYAYMQPLADFREFLSNTLFDLDRRTWIGRTIDEGFVAFRPDAYNSAQLQDMLRYALTIDANEIESSARLGIKPRFQVISIEALIAIDAQWSLHGFTRPMTALRIYREIFVEGMRYPVPKVPKFPKVDIPDAKWIYVGNDWDDTAKCDTFTGLRDVHAEVAAFDQPCSGWRSIGSKGNTRLVMDVATSESFSVDIEGATLLLDFELDRLVERFHGEDAKTQAGDIAFAGQGFKFYAQYGVISLSPNQVAGVDRILRRTAWRERFQLAGYNYNKEYASLIALEKGPNDALAQARIAKRLAARVLAESKRALRSRDASSKQLLALQQAEDAFNQAVRREAELIAESKAKKLAAELKAKTQAAREERLNRITRKRLTMTELYKEWAPDVPWRHLVRKGLLYAPTLPAHCSGKNEQSGRKRWALHHLPTLVDVIRCIKANPWIAKRVVEHRSPSRRRGYQFNLLAA